MVSKEKYEARIKNFLNKYKKVMGSETASNALKLQDWVRDYDSNMNKDVDVQKRKLYVKRGANLLNNFVESYNTVAIELQDMLLRCRLAILRGHVKKCNEKTKKELQTLINEYNDFVQAMIGCTDVSGEYILSILKKTSDILGSEYVKLKKNLEDRCKSLEKERVEDL